MERALAVDVLPVPGGPIKEELSYLIQAYLLQILAVLDGFPHLFYLRFLFFIEHQSGHASILPAARIGGRYVPLAPELFSIMADARLALGQISPERYSCDTPDGAGKDRQAALRRLARSVCADLEEIGEGAAMAIAEQACSRQKKILVAAISRQATELGLEKVVAAGTGEGLIAEAAAFLGMECLRISEKYGSKISDVFPGLCRGPAGGVNGKRYSFHPNSGSLPPDRKGLSPSCAIAMAAK